MKKIICFIIFVFIIDVSFSQQKDTIRKIDTIFIKMASQNEDISKNYAEILEKTNSQLSLWSNPYGILIATLGVLFAIFAIIGVFIIYRQSKEYKDLIKKSLDDHKVALDKLISEKNSQLRNYEISLDKSITDYKQKLETVGEEQKQQIKSFISNLEEQKIFVDTQIHTYRHSGWEFKDINENFPITSNTSFFARILLNSINQAFVIYIQIKTNDGKQIWLGFSGNNGNTTVTTNEYTQKIDNESNEVVINENILSVFKKGYPTSQSIPVQVITVRLRASNVDPKEIIFFYKIN